MELKEDTKYHVLLLRLWEPEPKLIWEGSCHIHIQKRPNGDIGVITPKPNEIPIPWAEYCQEDIENELDGSFHLVCEDYLMIIKREV